MNNKYFITASGTGVGKTLVTTGLYWQLNQAGHKVKAFNPDPSLEKNPPTKIPLIRAQKSSCKTLDL